MTLRGRVDSSNGTPTSIRSYNTWVVIGFVDPANLDPATPHRYAFYVHGLVGHFGVPSNVRNSIVEVALGVVDPSGTLVANGVLTHYRQRIHLADSTLSGITQPRACVPFTFLASFDGLPSTPDPIFGASFPANRGLAIIARINPSGDPISNGQFFVSDWFILTWDVQTLLSSDYLIEDTTVTTFTATGPGSKTQVWGGVNPLGAAGAKWLVFFWVRYRPERSGRAPRFEFWYVPSGGGTQVNLLGTQERWGLDGRLGLIGTSRSEWHHGGFRAFTLPTATTFVGCDVRDHYTAGGAFPPQTRITGFRFFAINMAKLFAPASDHASRFLRGAAQSVGQPVFFPFEFTIPGASNYLAIFQGIVDARALAARRQYSAIVFGDNQTPIFWFPWGETTLQNQFEGVTAAAVAENATALGVGARFEYANWPVQQPYPDLRDVLDVSVAAFGFEDDPDNLSIAQPGIGTTIVLIPDREAIDTASLTALTPEPDSVMSEVFERPRHTFRAGTGHTWRLPKFTAARRSFSLTWSNLDTLARDNLVAFLIANQALKWTPKGESTVLPFLRLNNPTTAQTGKTWQVTAELLELVWVGT